MTDLTYTPISKSEQLILLRSILSEGATVELQDDCIKIFPVENDKGHAVRHWLKQCKNDGIDIETIDALNQWFGLFRGTNTPESQQRIA